MPVDDKDEDPTIAQQRLGEAGVLELALPDDAPFPVRCAMAWLDTHTECLKVAASYIAEDGEPTATDRSLFWQGVVSGLFGFMNSHCGVDEARQIRVSLWKGAQISEAMHERKAVPTDKLN